MQAARRRPSRDHRGSGAREAARSKTPEAGLAWLGSGSGQLSRSPYLNLTPSRGCREWLQLGSASARLGSAARGPGTGKTGNSRAMRPCLRPRRPDERSALSRSRQHRGSLRGGALDRGDGGSAESWTPQPGRPQATTRDFRHLDGSCPQRAAQQV